MSAKDKLKKFFNYFENLFMKNHSCIGCGIEIPDGTEYQLCKNCREYLSKIEYPVCEKCGEEVLDGNILCDRCKVVIGYHFDKNKTFCYYDDVSANIVKAFKYNKRKFYAKHIAEMMTEDLAIFEDVDYLTFVPISNSRILERGFNQAEELAKEISKITKIEVIDSLIKLENGRHQAGLTRKERLENLKGSFYLKDEAKPKLKNKVVMIIDDVFTTGSTLSECAKMLKHAKPAEVKTRTFAKTKFENKI